VFGADRPDFGVFFEAEHADVGLSEGDVHGEVVEAEGFLGGFLEVVGVVDEVVGQVGVHLVEVPPVEVQRLRLAGVLAREFGDVVAVVPAVELLEPVDEFLVCGLGHSVHGR
jgi:hypothetical protein